MKNVIPLGLLRKRAREKKDKEQKDQTPLDPSLVHDSERKQSRYDKYDAAP